MAVGLELFGGEGWMLEIWAQTKTRDWGDRKKIYGVIERESQGTVAALRIDVCTRSRRVCLYKNVRCIRFHNACVQIFFVRGRD